jgi:hypothetical protein
MASAANSVAGFCPSDLLGITGGKQALLVLESFAASNSPTAVRMEYQELLVSHRKHWSGREDLNLRPPGSEPHSKS